MITSFGRIRCESIPEQSITVCCIHLSCGPGLQPHSGGPSLDSWHGNYARRAESMHPTVFRGLRFEHPERTSGKFCAGFGKFLSPVTAAMTAAEWTEAFGQCAGQASSCCIACFLSILRSQQLQIRSKIWEVVKKKTSMNLLDTSKRQVSCRKDELDVVLRDVARVLAEASSPVSQCWDLGCLGQMGALLAAGR